MKQRSALSHSKMNAFMVFLLITLMSITTILVSVPASASSGEHISNFDAKYTLLENGNVRVQEVITYNFGNEERRGIVRSLSTQERDGDKARDLDYNDISTLRNGQKTPVSSEFDADARQRFLYIGDPDTTVTGEQVYTINYTVKKALLLDPSNDQVMFNWHTTGKDWEVPISNVSAEVRWEGEEDLLLELTCVPDSSDTECQQDNNDEKSSYFLFSDGTFELTAYFPADSLMTASENVWYDYRGSAASSSSSDRYDDSSSTSESPLSLEIILLGLLVSIFIVLIGAIGVFGLFKNPFVKDPWGRIRFIPPNRNIVGDADLFHEGDIQPLIAKLLEQGAFRLDIDDPYTVVRTDWDHRDSFTPIEIDFMNALFGSGFHASMEEFVVTTALVEQNLMGRSDPYIKIWRDAYPDTPEGFYSGDWAPDTVAFFESLLPNVSQIGSQTTVYYSDGSSPSYYTSRTRSRTTGRVRVRHSTSRRSSRRNSNSSGGSGGFGGGGGSFGKQGGFGGGGGSFGKQGGFGGGGGRFGGGSSSSRSGRSSTRSSSRRSSGGGRRSGGSRRSGGKSW